MSVILAAWGAEIRKINVQGQPRQIVHRDLHLQNNQSKMNWRSDSSSRAPVLQGQSPEVQTLVSPKKKKKKGKKKKQNKRHGRTLNAHC
jgi:hypothetical protein